MATQPIELENSQHVIKYIEIESQKKHLYYERVFKTISQGQIVTWNWSAFCLCSVWLTYRKLYLRSFLFATIFFVFDTAVLGIIIAVMVMTDNIMQNIWALMLCAVVKIIYMMLCGALGNYWYYHHLQKKAKKGYDRLALQGTTAMLATLLACFPFASILFILVGINKFFRYILGVQESDWRKVIFQDHSR
ncbi:MAG: DUF2628 domain-containing protein [Alphaproteobacteria bacterium]